MDLNNTIFSKTVPKLQFFLVSFFFQGLDFNGHYQTVHLPHPPPPTPPQPPTTTPEKQNSPPNQNYAPQCQFFKFTGQKAQQFFNYFSKEFFKRVKRVKRVFEFFNYA